MLVAFLDQQSDVLTPQRKGVLFEMLARRLATQAGYQDVVLRAKHSSLEYDVEGRSVLHGLKLTGEAKAHEANIAGQVIAAFVGKLMPLAATGQVHGLFISTSGLTAEAKDYLEAARPTLSTFHIELRTLVRRGDSTVLR
jgi:restriction endonuclease Mrr